MECEQANSILVVLLILIIIISIIHSAAQYQKINDLKSVIKTLMTLTKNVGKSQILYEKLKLERELIDLKKRYNSNIDGVIKIIKDEFTPENGSDVSKIAVEHYKINLEKEYE